jgi:beta-1,4-mannooligosaccharide/beta-1,4-mannosyl-N-acetylglucosamine phosphorylase
LKYWGNADLLLAVEDVPFANTKLGPAAPPVRTKKGWLTIFHAVDSDPARGKNGWEPAWKKRYTAGIMLLALDNPKKIVGLHKEPLLAPEAPYEIAGGFRNNVIFPGGMILEDSGEVKIYYGAADTVECLATAYVNDLLGLCAPK